MTNKCKKSIDGKHHLENKVITYNKVYRCDTGEVINRLPVYAEMCLKCGLWGKVINNK